MKFFSLLILVLFFACSNPSEPVNPVNAEPKPQNITKSSFQDILDSAKVNGSILIYDAQEKSFYSNDFDWSNKGQLPASTFKIPNSIIALETGIVENDSTLFKWDGQSRALKVWEQDLVFRDAFHFSCVPCYQEVARKVGLQRMKQHVAQFNYGAIKVDSSTIDNFWLVGDSRISPFQQIDFLGRFYRSELPITARTEQIMKSMMVLEDKVNYKLSGKTGWSIDRGHDNGWFVGYLESKDNIYYFATNVEPQEQFDMNLFPMIRKAVTFQALREMGLME